MILNRSFLAFKHHRTRLEYPLAPILSENFTKTAIWVNLGLAPPHYKMTLPFKVVSPSVGMGKSRFGDLVQ